MEEKRNKGEIFTLILNNSHIEVDKVKLARKSRYFQSLFSHNFNDSKHKNHTINYDINFPTLEDFIAWIEDDGDDSEENSYPVKPSMNKFIKDKFEDLLNLLQLSVLFMVDELTEDIIELLVLNWLIPKKVIDIWLLAEELSLIPLRDMSFSVCLDQFEELPIPSLIELSKDNIAKLLGNVNIRSSKEQLEFVHKEWMQYHMESITKDILKQRKADFIQGMLVTKISPFVPKEPCIYVWDKTSLQELVKLRSVNNSDKDVIGMQVTGRGFNIYTVGGELGLGTGQFNKDIWRYSLISKKWYYQARLPVPRRHMVAAFIRNKLYIVGGVGRHRLKMLTMDVLNIHTNTWSKGPRIPEDFTEVPPHCVMNQKLFIIKSAVYIYYPEYDHWRTILIFNNPAVQKIDAVFVNNATLFITGNHLDEEILSRIDGTNDAVCEKEECIREHNQHNVVTNIDIAHEDESCQLRYGQVGGIGIMLLGVRDSCNFQYLHLQTGIRSDLCEYSFNPRLGYFNILHPNTLYNNVL